MIYFRYITTYCYFTYKINKKVWDLKIKLQVKR